MVQFFNDWVELRDYQELGRSSPSIHTLTLCPITWCPINNVRTSLSDREKAAKIVLNILATGKINRLEFRGETNDKNGTDISYEYDREWTRACVKAIVNNPNITSLEVLLYPQDPMLMQVLTLLRNAGDKKVELRVSDRPEIIPTFSLDQRHIQNLIGSSILSVSNLVSVKNYGHILHPVPIQNHTFLRILVHNLLLKPSSLSRSRIQELDVELDWYGCYKFTVKTDGNFGYLSSIYPLELCFPRGNANTRLLEHITRIACVDTLNIGACEQIPFPLPRSRHSTLKEVDLWNVMVSSQQMEDFLTGNPTLETLRLHGINPSNDTTHDELYAGFGRGLRANSCLKNLTLPDHNNFSPIDLTPMQMALSTQHPGVVANLSALETLGFDVDHDDFGETEMHISSLIPLLQQRCFPALKELNDTVIEFDPTMAGQAHQFVQALASNPTLEHVSIYHRNCGDSQLALGLLDLNIKKLYYQVDSGWKCSDITAQQILGSLRNNSSIEYATLDLKFSNYNVRCEFEQQVENICFDHILAKVAKIDNPRIQYLPFILQEIGHNYPVNYPRSLEVVESMASAHYIFHVLTSNPDAIQVERRKKKKTNARTTTRQKRKRSRRII